MPGIQLHSSTLLTLDGVAYRLAVQPTAPGLPVIRQGSQSLVYRVGSDSGSRALKVFGPRFRHTPPQAAARRLESLADLPGLQACGRTVFSPDSHSALLRTSPELSCAVLMPWIDGPTWEEVVLRREPLGASNTLWLARGLARVLSLLEQRGLAHCNLAGPNVLLPGLVADAALAEAQPVALVDVEELFAPGLERVASQPPAADGYAHPAAGWGPDGDRFAAAVMLGEMLGWSDARVRESTAGPSFFDPGELWRDGRRFRLLYWVLRELWGADVAGLFQRAWSADSAQACPAVAEWLALLLDLRAPAASAPPRVEVPIAAPPAVQAQRHAPSGRTMARAGVVGLCATACVAAGVLAAMPGGRPQPAVEFTPVRATPQPTTRAAAARPPTTRPTLAASPTPTAEEALDANKPGQAPIVVVRAQTLAADGAEAGQILAPLTPTPIPSPSPTPLPNRLPAAPLDTVAAVPAPVAAVRDFYQLVEQGPSPRAADLWSPRLRALFPPTENIISRFSHTRALVVEQADLVAFDPTAGRATVAVLLREQLDSPPFDRRYRGTWDLVRAMGGWLLDQPDLHLT